MDGLLDNGGSTDPRTLVKGPVISVLAAVAASFVPAYRASRIEPSDVLRSE